MTDEKLIEEAKHLIEQAVSFREQVGDDASPTSMIGLWLRTADALHATLAEFEKTLGEATVTPTAHEVTTDDERIEAWHYVADHDAFKLCYDEEQPLIDSVLARITQLHELETTVNELAPAPTLPLEPSDAQIDAMQEILYDDNREGDRDVIRRAWRAAQSAGGVR